MIAACMAIWWELIRMLGKSFSEPLPAITQAEKHLSESLHHDVVSLSGFGQHNVVDLFALKRTANWLDTEFYKAGYNVDRECYLVGK
jgi:hypothetical protein